MKDSNTSSGTERELELTVDGVISSTVKAYSALLTKDTIMEMRRALTFSSELRTVTFSSGAEGV
jgi:hypothetical protein